VIKDGSYIGEICGDLGCWINAAFMDFHTLENVFTNK
jgi:hypothetical protein